MRGFWGLVGQDCIRLVTRRRIWLVSAAFVVVGVGWIFVNRGSTYVLPSGRVRPTGPMLAVGAIDTLAGLVLFMPLLLGGSLSEDRVTGLSRLLLCRCGSRCSWVTSKIASIWFVALGFYLAAGAFLSFAAAAVAGWDGLGVEATVGVRTALASRPIALIAASCIALSLAAAAVASLSCVAAFFVRSPAVSLLVPVIAVFAGALALPPPLNPYVRASFLGAYFEWNSLRGVFAYWLAMLLVGWGACLVLSWVREE